MSRKNFRIIIHSKKIYHEVEVRRENGQICIGTTNECGVRFNKKLFFQDFKIVIGWEGDDCQMQCEGAVYFSNDGIRKLYSVKLEHGTEYRVLYLDNHTEVFSMEILYDFDEISRYDTMFAFPGKELMIGGTVGADVRIYDDIVSGEHISIKKHGNGYVADGTNSKLGVYINGKRYLREKEIPDGTFVMLAGYSFFLKNGMVYTAAKQNIKFAMPAETLRESRNVFRYPLFNRTARNDYQLREEQIEVLAPMNKAEEPEQNMLLMLAPVAVSLVLTIVIRGMMGSGGAFVIYSVCTMLMGAVMSVVTARMTVKKYRKKEQKRVDGYKAYIEEKEIYIEQAQEDERRIMEEKFLNDQRELELVEAFDERLFEKDIYDNDFLTVRLGTGDIRSKCEITYKKEEFKNTEDELTLYPEKLYERYRIIQNVPVVSSFKDANAVGILGNRHSLYNYFEHLVMEIAVRHFYKEAKMVFLLDGEEDQYQWIKWLKNVETEDGAGRLIASSEESYHQLLETLYAELTRREELGGENHITFSSFYIVFVTNPAVLMTHPLKRFIENAAANGFLFLFFEEYRENLPYGVSQIVTVQDDGTGELMFCDDCDKKQTFLWNELAEGAMQGVAEKLAPLEVAEISLESAMTKNISLFRLLGILNVTDLDLKSNWKKSQIYKSMAAPLGVKAGDEVVYLDLHEKAHGPHGLVAGTTGSGKSEILQSYILSMAILFHPYEVSFMIIDFKGGGMVNQFRNLPHLIGAITNIDGKEINRSLLSIKAELKKRQELFAQAEVNHINAYIKKFKKGECKTPLPHLILIVDEFAELKSDQPEFMKELISAARIGRSLGVHLILATQKPSGVVDNQIWSNSKFKLCLKVQNKEDSNEVLKSPLAAEIREPGRAYLQVGNNEIFELFQSAYSGASVRSEEIDHVKPFCLYEVAFHGKRNLIYEQKAAGGGEESQSQLEAIVDYVQEYCERERIEKLPGICLAPLTEYVTYDERTNLVEKAVSIQIPLGIYDDPAHQMQEEVWLDITSNDVFILGSAQYGKTNILQTILRSAAENYSPEEISFYILDFASMILKNFEKMNHVGGVVFLSDDEKLKTFMKMMVSELKERKEKLSGLGISSYAAYREAGYKEMPQIVIMVDNLAAFREVYGVYEDVMLKLLREGISAGISVIVTNGQTSGMGYKFLAAFSKRLGLFCNDSGEYSTLFDRCRMIPGNLAGRGLVEIERTVYEYQNYLSFAGEKEIERVSHIRDFVAKINKKFGNIRAKQIPEIPSVLTEQHMQDTYAINRRGTYDVPIGIDYEEIAPVVIPVDRCGVLGIMGREQSGKSNLVGLFMNQLYQNLFSNPAEIYLLDDGKRQLQRYEDMGNVKKYTFDASEYITWLGELHGQLQERYDCYLKEGDEALKDEPLLVYVVQNTESVDLLGKNAEAMKLYKEIVGKFRNLKWCIIYASLVNSAVPYSGPEVLKMLKENRNLIFFNDISNMKFLDVTSQQAKAYKKEIGIGDAFYFRDGDIVKIKTIKAERSGEHGY